MKKNGLAFLLGLMLGIRFDFVMAMAIAALFYMLGLVTHFVLR